MSYLIDLPKFKDERGILTLVEDYDTFLPFLVKRIFLIHDVTGLPRGGHKHYKTIEAIIMVKGTCFITTYRDLEEPIIFKMEGTDKCLILPANEWRILHDFSSDAFLLVFSSEKYSTEDYILPKTI